MDEKVKGSVLLPFVKILRRSKDERLYEYLTEEDMPVISSTIFPAGWYPLPLFHRLMTAFFDVYGERKPANAREWGKNFGIQILTGVYKDTAFSIEPGNILQAVKTFVLISRKFFSHSHLEVTVLEPRSAQLTFTQPSSHQAERIFYFILCGTLEKYIEMSGGNEPYVYFSEKALAEKKAVTLHVNWN